MIEVKLKINRRSAEAVKGRLYKLRKATGGKAGGGTAIRQANRKVGIWVLRWINENFKTEGGKVGQWEKFKYGGRVKKGKINTSAKLLQDTGRLRASFDYKATKSNVTIGSNLKYSKYHEGGVPQHNLPIRRMLPLNTDGDVTTALLKIYDHAIEKALK